MITLGYAIPASCSRSCWWWCRRRSVLQLVSTATAGARELARAGPGRRGSPIFRRALGAAERGYGHRGVRGRFDDADQELGSRRDRAGRCRAKGRTSAGFSTATFLQRDADRDRRPAAFAWRAVHLLAADRGNSSRSTGSVSWGSRHDQLDYLLMLGSPFILLLGLPRPPRRPRGCSALTCGSTPSEDAVNVEAPVVETPSRCWRICKASENLGADASCWLSLPDTIGESPLRRVVIMPIKDPPPSSGRPHRRTLTSAVTPEFTSEEGWSSGRVWQIGPGSVLSVESCPGGTMVAAGFLGRNRGGCLHPRISADV